MTDQANSIWQLPDGSPSAGGAGRTAEDIETWRTLVEKVATLATTSKWSKAEVARRVDMPDGTFSQWFSGKYAGRLDTTNAKVRQWLDQVEEMSGLAKGIPISPPFILTRTAREVVETLTYAQMLPEMCVITLGAGMGKTATCKHYAATRPHAYIATMTPHTKTVYGMMNELAFTLGITQHNPARLHRAIGERLQRNGKQTLLIIDEAQNLVDAAIDQLRSLLDINQCGIALVGNDEIYDRFKNRQDGPSYAQIKRRIGKRLRRLKPHAEDIDDLIAAWGVADDASRRFLTGIGMKPGALGQIDKTMKLAGMLAASGGEPVGEKHIRAAWTNRSVED